MKQSIKSDKVYNFLKQKIVSNQYKPGEWIVIQKVSDELQISGTPIREAMERLASEGLIENIPHSGARVAQIDLDTLEQIFLIRTELEVLAATLAARNITDSELAVLSACVEDMDLYQQAEDAHMYSESNHKFHTTLYHACKAAVLIALIENLYSRSERSKLVFQFDHRRLIDSNDEHRQIVEALRVGDEATVGQIIRKQKEQGFSVVLATLRGTMSVLGL